MAGAPDVAPATAVRMVPCGVTIPPRATVAAATVACCWFATAKAMGVALPVAAVPATNCWGDEVTVKVEAMVLLPVDTPIPIGLCKAIVAVCGCLC